MSDPSQNTHISYFVDQVLADLEAISPTQTQETHTPMIHREQDIINWGLARNIIGPESQSNRAAQQEKTEEEVFELHDAIDAENRADAKDAIGDIIVTLALQANMWGLTLTECLDAAWEEIRDRKGRMVDGIFVKEAQ